LPSKWLHARNFVPPTESNTLVAALPPRRQGIRLSILRQAVSRVLPQTVRRVLRSSRDSYALQRLQRTDCDVANLRAVSERDLREFLRPQRWAAEWEEVSGRIAAFRIPDGTGGVNPGDRRAVYYLVRSLGARSVLEVGTHIGASTAHIALALENTRRQEGAAVRLLSVDISDVNSPVERPWTRYGMAHSPRAMVEALGCADLVTFKTQTSLDYARAPAAKPSTSSSSMATTPPGPSIRRSPWRSAC
jgi:hypothetical protein